MLKRYTKESMGNNWSDKTKFTNWVRVEAAVLRAKVQIGQLKVEVPEHLESSIEINVEEINRIEDDITRHDVIAFLMHTSRQLPEELRPYWHDQLTSYDPQDTGLSLQLVHSIDLLEMALKDLVFEIKQKAVEHKDTPEIGRSHGIHAEPITFGFKLANWYSECQRHLARLRLLRELVAVGKISGAMGIYTLDPEIEELVCKQLGLKPITTTQIISRDIIAEYVSTLAIIGGSIEKICVNIRTLQRTEISEAQEYFSPTQRGSSAMPHKRNPISSENLSGMSRVLRGYASMARENQNTWDERDIANSGPERIFLPDASILLDYMLQRLTGVIKKWIIYPDKMRENLNLTKGLVFSQEVQTLVVKKSGLPREDAYKLVRDIAQRCWDTKEDFMKALLRDKKIMRYVTKDELKKCFDLEAKLQHVDYIFEQVFGKEE